MEKELRFFESELRASKTEDKVMVRGYAAKYNTLSENLGGFRETIAPGFFDELLGDDVRALLNHDNSLILGRTVAGTLRIGTDEVGLWYEYDDPGTSYSRDLLISLERGDIDKSSFQFTVEEDKWEEDAEGRYVRTLVKGRKLYDVSPVTYPAYLDTNVAKRSLETFQEATKPPIDPADLQARELKVRFLTINKQ